MGHEVKSGEGAVRLTGRLQLAQPPLFIPPDHIPLSEFGIDRCTFTPAGIEFCVRSICASMEILHTAFGARALNTPVL